MKQLIKSMIPYSIGVWLREKKQILQSYYYKGTKYHCPYCNHSFRKLQPAGSDFKILKEKEVIGAGFRENALCPRCHSTDRDRLIYLFIQKNENLLGTDFKLLHLAPEKSLKKFLQANKNINYYAGDKFEEEYSGFYYDQDVHYMDLLDLKSDSESYDGIICNHVLEHITEENLAMSELYRVMKKGGWGIFQVPYSPILDQTIEQETNSPKEREDLFGQFDHIRLYGKDYSKRLAKIGFEVNEVDLNEIIDTATLAKFAVNPKENIFFVRKQ